MSISRRTLIKHLGAIMSIAPLMAVGLPVETLISSRKAVGNFSYIYGNQKLRSHFKPFLKNVFHLYPDDKLDALIGELVKTAQTDEEVYIGLQEQLPEITPFLADLRYALPALNHQKRVMASQTISLLGEKKIIDGYLEFGSVGRYQDGLEDILEFKGPAYYVAERKPTSSVADIIDRGQFSVGGEFMLLDNYSVDVSKKIERNSLDLATVYIGFHHCPPERRDELITSIREVLKPGGCLVVRDHNAHNEDMFRCVALAHDVFNMGTHEPWTYNAAEQRYFYSLAILNEIMERNGFRGGEQKLYQPGDPTLNALMLYRKV